MSYKIGAKPRITPLLQHELTRQLAKTTDALDYGDIALGFRCLKTLIIISPPEVKKRVLPNWDLMEAQIEKARTIRKVDLKQTRTSQKLQVTAILRQNLRPLLNQVMNLLYDGGFLMADITPRFPSDKELSVEGIEQAF